MLVRPPSVGLTLDEYRRDLPYRDVIVGPPYGEHTVIPGEPRPPHEIVRGADGVHRCACGRPGSRQHGSAFASESEGCTAALVRYLDAQRTDGHDPGDEDA